MLIRKIISIILVLIFATGIFPLYAIDVVASNSKPSDWAVEEIEKANEYNLTTQRVLSNYQQNITREEFCEMIIKLYEQLSGKSAELPQTNIFKDTSNSEVLKANKLGIVEGVSIDEFSPLTSITREQIAVMFHRTLEVINSKWVENNSEPIFEDKHEISFWAVKAVGFAGNKGIINGMGNNRFNPKGYATREQAIALMIRTYKKFADLSTEEIEYFIPDIDPTSSNEDPIVSVALPTGEGYLINQEVDLSKAVKVVTDELSITIPSSNEIGSSNLTVKNVDNIMPHEQLDIRKIFDIKLGDIKDFYLNIEIEIPLSSSDKHLALYYNENTYQWEDIPHIQDGRKIVIKTNHLSKFGVAEVKSDDYYNPRAKIWYYYPNFYEIEKVDVSQINKFGPNDTTKYAFDKGWDASKKWFDVGTVSVEMFENSISGLKNLNDAIGNMGKVISPIQIYFDIRNGKHVDAAANAYEMALGTWFSRFGEAGANIGLLGASLINMSIKEFAQEAISSKESQYEKAYAYYYNNKNSLNRIIKIRDSKDWYDAFYTIIETSPKHLNDRINADIERYVREIWYDAEGLLTAQGIIGQQGQSSSIVGGGAYLNDDLKERLSNNYRYHLTGYLEVILNKAIDDYEWNERKKFKKEYGDKVVSELNKEYTVRVKVNTNEGQQVKVNFDEPFKVGWEGFTDNQGNWEMTFTMLGYLRAGCPSKIVTYDALGNRLEALVDFENLNIILGEEQKIQIIYPQSVKTGEIFEIGVNKNGEPYAYVNVSSSNPILNEYNDNSRSSAEYKVPSQPGIYEVQVKDTRTNSTETIKIKVEESELSRRVKEDIAKFNYGHDFEPLDYSNLIMKARYSSGGLSTGVTETTGRSHLGVEFYKKEFLNGWWQEIKVAEIYYMHKSHEYGENVPQTIDMSNINFDDFKVLGSARYNSKGEAHGKIYVMNSAYSIEGNDIPVWRTYEFNNGMLLRFIEYFTADHMSSKTSPTTYKSHERIGQPFRFEVYQKYREGGKKTVSSGGYVHENLVYKDGKLISFDEVWKGDSFDTGFDYTTFPIYID